MVWKLKNWIFLRSSVKGNNQCPAKPGHLVGINILEWGGVLSITRHANTQHKNSYLLGKKKLNFSFSSFFLYNINILFSQEIVKNVTCHFSVTCWHCMYRVFLNHWSIIDLYCGRNFDNIVLRFFAMCSHGSGNFFICHTWLSVKYFFL